MTARCGSANIVSELSWGLFATARSDRIHHKSSRRPRKNGCRTFPSADFARYSISARNLGSTQMPLCRCALGLSPSDHGFKPLLQIGGRDLVKAVVDFAGVDQIVALAPADVEPIPLRTVECEAGLRLATKGLTPNPSCRLLQQNRRVCDMPAASSDVRFQG
jgi:hypothetical protein